MNLEKIPNTLLTSIVKNGKAIAPIALAGIATLAIVDTVKAVRK